MNLILIRGVALAVVATFLLTFSSIAVAPAPTRTDSRDVLVVSLFAAGIGFALLAGIELRRLRRTLRTAAA